MSILSSKKDGYDHECYGHEWKRFSDTVYGPKSFLLNKKKHFAFNDYIYVYKEDGPDFEAGLNKNHHMFHSDDWVDEKKHGV